MPRAGFDMMAEQVLPVTNGKVTLTVTETPIFVKCVSGSARVAAQAEITPDWTQTVEMFPNPATDVMTVGWTASYTGPVSVRVLDANLGLTHQTLQADKNSPVFRTTLDVSALPYGLHLVEIQQGSERVVRRILKVR